MKKKIKKEKLYLKVHLRGTYIYEMCCQPRLHKSNGRQILDYFFYLWGRSRGGPGFQWRCHGELGSRSLSRDRATLRTWCIIQ